MSDTPERRPVAAWLQEQRGGSLHGELTDALAELTTAVCEHDKPGSLTLTISLRPNGPGAVIASDSITTRAPKPDRGASFWFADGRGNLSRRDPRQPELPLREVPAEDAEVRELGS